MIGGVTGDPICDDWIQFPMSVAESFIKGGSTVNLYLAAGLWNSVLATGRTKASLESTVNVPTGSTLPKCSPGL